MSTTKLVPGIVIILVLIVLLFTGCTPEQSYDASGSKIITNIKIQNDNVIIETINGSKYLYYPQLNKVIYDVIVETVYESDVLLIEINNTLINKINPYEVSGGYIYLKRADIEKIFNYYNLPIPENIPILGQNIKEVKQQKPQKENDKASSDEGMVLLIILGFIGLVIFSIFGISKIIIGRIEEKEYRENLSCFYIKQDSNYVYLNFNLKELNKRYEAAIPKNKATEKKIQKVKERMAKIVDKEIELNNYLQAVESAYNELNKE
jgi:hypothetical protein